MNRIYRVIWNEATGSWVVASEMAKGRKKKSSAGGSLGIAIASVGVLGSMIPLDDALAVNLNQGGSVETCQNGSSIGSGLIASTGAAQIGDCYGTADAVFLNGSYASRQYSGTVSPYSWNTSYISLKNGLVEMGAASGIQIDNQLSMSSQKIVSLAKGTVSAFSGDAVNGSQLYNTALSAASVIGGGASVDANGGVTSPNIIVGGKSYTNVTAAIQAAAATGGDALNWNASTLTYDAAHTGSATNRITHLAAGTASTDAVNVSQLKGVTDAIGGGTGVDPITGAIVNPSIKIGNTTYNTVAAAIQAAASTGGDALNWNASTSTYDAAHTGSATNRIAHVAAGTATTDAVNVSQLKGVADAIGGGTGIDPTTGAIVNPSIKVGDTTYNNVAQAIEAAAGTGGSGGDALNWNKNTSAYDASHGDSGTNKITNVTAGTDPNDAVNKQQLDDAVDGFNGLSDKLKYIKFGATTALDAAASGNNSLAIGGAAQAGQNGSVAIGGNTSAGGVNSVAVGYGSVATDANEFSVGGGKIQRRVTNVADGVLDSDAATVGQMNTAIDNALNPPKKTMLMSSGSMLMSSGSMLGASAPSSVTPDKLVFAGPNGDTLTASNAIGNKAFAAGLDAHANADNAVAIGQQVNTLGAGGIVVGVASGTNAVGGVVIGGGSTSLGGSDNSVIIGNSSSIAADQPNSVAIGYYNKLGGTNTVGIGDHIAANGDNNVILGSTSSDDNRDNVVSVGSTGKVPGSGKNVTRQIINVAAGTQSTDVVNVSQLKGVTDALGGGMTIDSTTGAVNQPTYTVAGNSVTGVDKAIAALDTRSTAIANDALSWDATGGAYSAKHGDQAQSRITNVADAVDDYDAVNKQTLDSAIANIPTNPLAVSYDDASKTTLTLNKGGDAVSVSNVAAGKNNDDAVNVKQLKDAGIIDPDGNSLDAVVYDANSSKGQVTFGGANGTVLDNVAAGTVSANSKQAINGSQLYGTAQSVADALGGNSAVDSTGKISTPTYTVDGKDAVGVDGAIAALDTGVKSAKDGIDGLNADMADAVKYDTSTHDKVTLNQGGSAATLANVAAGKDDNDAVNVKQLKDAGIIDPDGNSLDAVVYDANSNKGQVTFGGANGTVLDNVAAGTVSANSKQAINGSQLYGTAQSVADALGGNSAVDSTGKISTPTYTVDGKDAVGVDGAIAALDTGVKSAKDGIDGLNADMADAVKYDSSAHDKVTLNNGGDAVSLTNVADATGRTDAVNLGQLQDAGLFDKDGNSLAVAYDDAGKSSVTFNKGGTPTTLHNVATGQDPNDAVNVQQLNDTVSGFSDLADKIKYIKFGGTDALDAAASGNNALAIGGYAQASKDGSVSIGGNTSAGGVNSVAVGYGSVATADNEFSVGGGKIQRRITNVADGVADNDAATVGQMNTAIDNALNPPKKTMLMSSSSTLMSSGSMLGAAATSSVTPDKLVFAGPNGDTLTASDAKGNKAFAGGLDAHANADNAVAIGQQVNVLGVGGLVVGVASGTNAVGGVVIGGGSASLGGSDNSVVIGNSSSIAADQPNAVAIGYYNKIGGTNTVGIGDHIVANGDNNIVLGSTSSDDNRENVVSVGSTGKVAGSGKNVTRQIINVAAGTQSTDVVNVSQLKGVTDALGGGASIDGTTGAVSAPTYSVANGTYNNVSDALKALDNQSKTGNPLGVAYDDNTYATVTLKNKANGGTTIAGVAAGKNDDEAVNVKQLKDAGIIDPNGNSLDAVVYDAGSNKGRVTFGGASGTGTLLDNVAVGTVGVNSLQAINGSQLFGTAQSVADALGGKSAVDVSGQVTKPAYTLGTTTYDNVGDALKAAYDNGGGTGVDALAWNGTAYDAKHGSSSTSKIVNVANGTANNDAVNVGQFTAAINGLGGGASIDPTTGTVTGPTYNITNKDGDTVTVNNAGDAFKTIDGRVTNIYNDINDGTIGLVQQAAAGQKLTVGKDTDGSEVNFTGTAGDRTLTGVAAGAVNATSTQAVNGSQLFGTAQSVANALGGTNGGVDANGNVKTPTYKVGSVDVNGVGAAIAALDNQSKAGNVLGMTYDDSTFATATLKGQNGTTISNVAAGKANGDAVNVKQLKDAGIIDPNGNTLDAVVYDAGSNKGQVTFGGGAKGTLLANVAAGAVNATSNQAINGSQLFGTAQSVANALGGTNGGVDASGNVKTPTYKVGSVDYAGVGNAIAALDNQSKSGNALGMTYDDATFATATLKGQNGTTISNVAAGKADGDAVNVKQLKDAGIIDPSGNPLQAVVYDAGSNKGQVTFGGASGTVLANVAAGKVGANSNQAINGSQLYGTAKSVADALGGNSTVNGDGTVSAPSYALHDADGNAVTATNVGDALTNLDGRVTGNTQDINQLSQNINYVYYQGTKYAQFNSTGAEAVAGGTESVALGGNANAKADNSVALGSNSVADRDNTVSVGAAGSERQITNVAAGTQDTDAVNVAQLKAAGIMDHAAVTYDNNADGTTNNNSITLNGGDAGTVIHNVANGTTATDAVNKGQLDAAMSDAIAQGGGNNPMFQAQGDKTSEQASATGTHATAMGANASATADNSVALGAGSVADRANAVSVGSAGNERQITNVAAATADTDAVNYQQYKSGLSDTLNQANSYTDSQIQQNWAQTADQFNQMNNKINQVDKTASRGIAAASALINVTPYVPGHTAVNGGVANYRGQTALGIGVSRWSDNGRFNINGGVAASQGGGDAVVRVGVGYVF